MLTKPRCTKKPSRLPPETSAVPVVMVARLALMKPAPSIFTPAGLAMMTSARGPATSTKPRSWLGLLELTSLRITRALPVASHGLPGTQPPSWVCTLVRELFSTTPGRLTSNWL